jgi:competence protein ComEC
MEGFGLQAIQKFPLSFLCISILLCMGSLLGVLNPFDFPLFVAASFLVFSWVICCSRYIGLSALGWLIAGFSFAVISGLLAFSRWLPQELDGKEIEIRGTIIDFPRAIERGWQFDFYAEELGGKIRLGLYDQEIDSPPPDFSCRYHLLVKLKRPRGLLNFQQYDYQAWLLQSGYLATGYVRSVKYCEPYRPGFVLNLRSAIAGWINASSISDNAKSTLMGLLIGSYADIDVFQWQTLRDSGTIHLLSVSGLHIVLVAALVHFIVNRGVSFLVFPLRWLPADYWAGCAAIVFATIYALLAGFSVATQRSLIMVTVAVLQRFLYGRFAFGYVFFVSMLLVLMINPLSVLSSGFWFSYLATAVLLLSNYGYKKIGNPSVLSMLFESLRLQWVVFILMAPVLLYVYARMPLLSLPMNLLAVPWVSFLTLPLGFAALLVCPVSQQLAEVLLQLSGWTLDVYWQAMHYGVDIGKNWEWVLGGVSIAALVLASIALFLFFLVPSGVPLRLCGVFLCLPLFYPGDMGLSQSGAEVTVLDVGQGLAVIVRTARHVLVYDTGDRRSDRFDAGRDIVAPALRNLRVDKIDMLMVSHSDSDHAAGRTGLLNEFSARQLWSGTPEQLSGPESFLPCREGMQWRWDGVIFKVLSPDNATYASDNNRGCVVLVDAGKKRVLLTGDIEKEVENKILGRGIDISADILLAPHHGSKTSSSPGFLDAVNASTIVVSSGFHNRFRHPAERIVERYEERGAVVLNTAELGAVRLRLSAEGIDIQRALCARRFFWRIERYNDHCRF